MTAEQHRLYTGMLRLFRSYATGGPNWTPVTASGAGIATAATFTVGALVSLYVLEASLIRKQLALPAVGIYAAAWWGLPLSTSQVIAPGVVLVSAADATRAFLVDGAADRSQGFPVFPLASCAVPNIDTAGRFAGYQAGLRIGAW